MPYVIAIGYFKKGTKIISVKGPTVTTKSDQFYIPTFLVPKDKEIRECLAKAIDGVEALHEKHKKTKRKEVNK